MKFGEVIEYNIKNGFLQNHLETKTWRLLPEPISFFQKALYEVKASGQHRSFNNFNLITQGSGNRFSVIFCE